MNSLLTLLIVCCPILSSASYDYQTFKTTNGRNLTGQIIGEYEERWFWEAILNPNKYVGVFSLETKNPKIYFVNKNDIVKSKIESKEQSSYNQYLKTSGLFLKQAPLNGWNYITTGNEDHHLFENMFGNFAWDISKIHAGKTFSGEGFINQEHYVWSEPVFSPVKGTVIGLVRDIPDNEANPANNGDLSNKGDGNYILLHSADSFYFIFMHFKKDSIPETLTLGSIVNVGDLIGEVGNSGVSYTPHLHMTMYYWSSELNRMMSVPTFVSGVEMLTTPTAEALILEQSSPRKGQLIRTVNK